MSDHLGKEGMFERGIVLGDRSILFEGGKRVPGSLGPPNVSSHCSSV